MKQYFYLIHIQYLGFRFHGWAKQPNVKTIHHMIDKTLPFVLGHSEFKTLGSSRTDAMVSANHAVFELFLKEPLDVELFFDTLNSNLPTDIRVIEIIPTDDSFNIIQSPKLKEYLYLFAVGEKCHPFCAPILASFMENMDIELMKEGARLFEGRHNFRKYCTKPSEKTNFDRIIDKCQIEENTSYTASFFPARSYACHIHGKGFMRNQIRLMMGTLFRLGRGELGLEDIKQSLRHPDDTPLDCIAPASGLILNKVQFEK
ncbi:MAG: tRNA pseudouridine(38-40) synthase TruA [Cyclobacteriaceae bacterium]|nr:tRNA pseudouridine(38-40) synthase TruA [Cyclobacteriaceae bacterium]